MPAGFNPATALANYSSLGLVHTAGTTLTLSAGQGFSGIGSIGDPVVCQGTITAQSGYFVNLNNGLVLSAGGNASLGSGSLTANNAVSGISGGSLSAGNEYFGKGGTAVFTQSAGNNSAGNLYLGYNVADHGAYNLTGTGQLSGTQYIGYSGAGTL